MPTILTDDEPQTHLKKILPITSALAMSKKIVTDQNICQTISRLSEKIIIMKQQSRTEKL
jgi:hypothetical protein